LTSTYFALFKNFISFPQILAISVENRCWQNVQNPPKTFFFFPVLAISVFDTKMIETIKLDRSFPLKLRKTKYGDIMNRVDIPKEALQENAYRGLTKSVFFAYKTLHDLLIPAEKYIKNAEEHMLNSRIVSASIGQGRHIQLPKKVQLQLTHMAPNLTDPICVFWNFELSGWSDSGCKVVKTNSSSTTCECDHLTNFALLMRAGGPSNGAKLSPSTILVLEVVTYVAVALSIVFIFIILYKVRIMKKLVCNSYLCIAY
jgi:latrophilin 1